MLAIGKKIQKGGSLTIVTFAIKGLYEQMGIPSSLRFLLEFLMVIAFVGLFCHWYGVGIKKYIVDNTFLKYYALYTALICVLGIVLFPTYASISLVVNGYLVILALPLISYIFSSSLNLSVFVKLVIYVIFPFSLIKYFGPYRINMSNFSGYVSFIYLLLIFSPFITSKVKKLIIYLFAFLSLTYELNDRTNLLMIIGCIFIITIGPFFSKLGVKKKRFAIWGLSFLPIFFIILVYISGFNVLEFANMIEKEGVSNVDTRTVLYAEVFSNNDLFQFIFGRSAAGGYYSSLASVYGLSTLYRQDVETGILLYYLKGGIIWCFIYWGLLLFSALKSVTKSNNKLGNYISLYIMLYWLLSFIELQPSFNTWTATLFMALGIANSREILTKTDTELKTFINAPKFV